MHTLYAKCCDEVALEGREGCTASRIFELVDISDKSIQERILSFLERSPAVIVNTAEAEQPPLKRSKRVANGSPREGVPRVYVASKALIESALGIGSAVTGVRRDVVEITDGTAVEVARGQKY